MERGHATQSYNVSSEELQKCLKIRQCALRNAFCDDESNGGSAIPTQLDSESVSYATSICQVLFIVVFTQNMLLTCTVVLGLMYWHCLKGKGSKHVTIIKAKEQLKCLPGGPRSGLRPNGP